MGDGIMGLGIPGGWGSELFQISTAFRGLMIHY
jgi:hypothetical protein